MHPVPIRTAWSNEATDFTPWLAREENFATLAETLHFSEAEVEATEKGIGAFSADIVARDLEGLILVENQLEQSDHTHLGQILTYLAGLGEPARVVWVCTKLREEHRAAIDWLNAHTPTDYAFFAVELELYRIDDSTAAPYFHVAARPNDWTRHQSARSRQAVGNATTDLQRQYQRFWTDMAQRLADDDPTFEKLTPPKFSFWTLGFGRVGFNLTLLATVRDRWIGAELTILDDEGKEIFDALVEQRTEIEADFGGALDWDRLDGRKSSRVGSRRYEVDPLDSENWPEFASWYQEQVAGLRTALSERVRMLDVHELRSGRSPEQGD